MAEIVISPALVQDWERKQKDAVAKAEAYSKEAAQWGQKVQAARLILSSADIEVPHAANGAPASESDDNMTAAIEAIANSSDFPLSNRDMKERLRSQGFPDDRLANYYYTAVSRLKGKLKITVDADKKIGPGLI